MLQQARITCVREAAGVGAAGVRRGGSGGPVAGIGSRIHRHVLGVRVAAQAKVAAGQSGSNNQSADGVRVDSIISMR